MGWRDDAQALLDLDDEPKPVTPDWRSSVRDFLAQQFPEPAPSSPRTFSSSGLATLKEREGSFYGTPYKDSGGDPKHPWAIAYGQRFWKGKPVTPDLNITQDEGDQEFQRQVDTDYGKSVLDALKVPVTQNQLDSLLSIRWNHKATAERIIAKLNAGETPDENDFTWSATVNGVPNEGLLKRRRAEHAQFFTPDTPSGQADTVSAPATGDWRDEVRKFLADQEVDPLGPEVDVVKQGMRATMGGPRQAPLYPPSAADIEKAVIGGSPATQSYMRPNPYLPRTSLQGQLPKPVIPPMTTPSGHDVELPEEAAQSALGDLPPMPPVPTPQEQGPQSWNKWADQRATWQSMQPAPTKPFRGGSFPLAPSHEPPAPEQAPAIPPHHGVRPELMPSHEPTPPPPAAPEAKSYFEPNGPSVFGEFVRQTFSGAVAYPAEAVVATGAALGVFDLSALRDIQAANKAAFAPAVAASVFDDPKGTLGNPLWWADAGGSVAGSIIGLLSAGEIGGPAAAILGEAWLEGMNSYSDAIEAGASPNDAGIAAVKTISANVPLLLVTESPLFEPATKNKIVQALVNVASEGSQEYSQEVIQNVAAQGYDPDRETFRNAADAAIIGGVVGPIAGHFLGKGREAIEPAAPILPAGPPIPMIPGEQHVPPRTGDEPIPAPRVPVTPRVPPSPPSGPPPAAGGERLAPASPGPSLPPPENYKALIDGIKQDLAQVGKEKPGALPEQKPVAGSDVGGVRPVDEGQGAPVGGGKPVVSEPPRAKEEETVSPPAPQVKPSVPVKPVSQQTNKEILERMKRERAARAAANYQLTPPGEREPAVEEEPPAGPTRAELEEAGQKPLDFETEPPVVPAAPDRHAQLEQMATDEAMGVTFEEDGTSVLPNGEAAVNCTNCARRIIALNGGQGEIYGWEEDNPAKRIVSSEDGHDFAVIDGRYLVDPWAKNVEAGTTRAVFDLDSPVDRTEVLRLYGDPEAWVKASTPLGDSLGFKPGRPSQLGKPATLVAGGLSIGTPVNVRAGDRVIQGEVVAVSTATGRSRVEVRYTNARAGRQTGWYDADRVTPVEQKPSVPVTSKEEDRVIPGLEGVREQEVPTPKIELPFSLTGETLPAEEGTQEGLFGDTEEPANAPEPEAGRPVDRLRMSGENGVPPSRPRERETATERETRKEAHHDAVFQELAGHAKAIGESPDLVDLRDEFDYRINALEEREQAMRGEDVPTAQSLLQAIADLGGLGPDSGYPGELKWLKGGQLFGTVQGVRNVFRAKYEKNSQGVRVKGHTLDGMLTLLGQDARFTWIKNINMLIDAVDDAIRHPIEDDTGTYPGTAEYANLLQMWPDEPWWKDSWRPDETDEQRTERREREVRIREKARLVREKAEGLKKLKKISKKRQKAATDVPIERGSGEMGMALSVEPDDDSLEAMIATLRGYIDDGITDFRQAIIQFQKDTGPDWAYFKDDLELAWHALLGERPGMDAPRPVDEALNEEIKRRIEKSPDWRPYERRTTLDGQSHPKVVVEAKALAGVPYPELVIETPEHVKRALAHGWVSVEQAEQMLAAIQANSGDKPHGYLIADAVGLGKSREIALAVNEFMRGKGDRRLLVVTKSKSNLEDLIQNFAYTWSGLSPEGIDLNDPNSKPDPEGEKGSVPYEVIDLYKHGASKGDISEPSYKPLPKHAKAIYLTTAHNLTDFHYALSQLGLHGIVGDEAHVYKNVWGAERAKAWQSLHAQIFKEIPRAEQRFLYATATPTQDISQYEYLYGLRLWPIDGFNAWVQLITGRLDAKDAAEVVRNADIGMIKPEQFQKPDPGKPRVQPVPQGAAMSKTDLRTITPAEMEQVPRELKMLGRMSARDLWREGTEFQVHQLRLPEHHGEMLNRLGTLARDVLDAVERFAALDQKNGGKNKGQSLMRAMGMLQFAAKRFALQPTMEEAIKVAQEAMKKGFQPVIRVINVGRLGAQEDVDVDGQGKDDAQYYNIPLGGHLKAAIDAINTREVVLNRKGDIIKDEEHPGARQYVDALIERAKAFTMEAPLDMLEKAVGKENVAVKIGSMSEAMKQTVKDFQRGLRQVLLISAAGSTGINLDHRVVTDAPAGHEGKWEGGRRMFINAQFDWSATEEMQAIGRVDRASSITQPYIKPITFGNAVEARFLGNVAARMASLGATSRGGASATGGAKGLEQFEVSGADTLAAIRNVWLNTPDSIKQYFWGKRYRDANGAPVTALGRITPDDVQRAMLFVPIDKANQFWNQVLAERELIRQRAQDVGADARTHAFSGEVQGKAELVPGRLTLYKLKNEEGHRFGLLVGVIMPEVPRLKPFLSKTASGQPQRRYVSFTVVGKPEAVKVGDMVEYKTPDAEGIALVSTVKDDTHFLVKDTNTHEEVAVTQAQITPRVGPTETLSGLEVLISRTDDIAREYRTEFPKPVVPVKEKPKAAKTTKETEETPGELGYGSTRSELPPPPLGPMQKPSAIPAADVKSPSQMIAEARKTLGLPTRQGGFRSTKPGLIIYGIFKWGGNKGRDIIRLKESNDIPTWVHEIGHALDKKYKFFGRFLNAPWKYELIALGQNTSASTDPIRKQVMEGVAEFVRLYLSDPAKAIQDAPIFMADFEQTLDAHDRATIRALQTDIDHYVQLSYPQRLAKRIDYTGGNLKANEQTWWEQFHQAVFHDFGRLDQMVDDVGRPVKYLDDPAKILQMSRGHANIAQGFLEHGIKIKGVFVSKGMREILAPVKDDLNNFVAYLVALRAKELAGRDKNTGISKAEYESTINEFKNNTDFEQARLDLKEFTTAQLDFMKAEGFIDQASYNAMLEANKFYVPFMRVLDGFQTKEQRKARGAANRQSPLRRIGSSQRDIINPIESIVRNMYLIVDETLQNKVMQTAVRLVGNKNQSGKWMDRVENEFFPIMFNLENYERQIRQQLENQPDPRNNVVLPKDIDLNRILKIWMPKRVVSGKKGYQSVVVDGKRQTWSTNDLALFDTFDSLGPKALPMWMQLTLEPPARLVRAAWTGMSLAFGGRNIQKDIVSALIYGKASGYTPDQTFRGIFHSVLGRVKGEEVYKQFRTEGVMAASIMTSDRRVIQRQIREWTGTKAVTMRERIRDTVTTPFDYLQAVVELSEEGTRLGVFMKVLQREEANGIPLPEALARATIAARNSTQDFQMGGAMTRQWGQVTAFLNSRVHGYQRFAKAVKEAPALVLTRTFLAVTMTSVLLWYLRRLLGGKVQDVYDEEADYAKKTQWYLPAPWTQSGFIKFQKPFEIGTVFGTGAEVVLDYLYAKDPEATMTRLKDIVGDWGDVKHLQPAELALHLGEYIGLQLMPSVALPMTEIAFNYSSFRDRPVVPTYKVGIENDLQFTRWTPESVKFVANHIGMWPLVLDYMVQGYLGSAGRAGTEALDLGMGLGALGARKLGITEGGATADRPFPALSRIPVLSSFYREGVDESSQSLQDLYRKLDKAEKRIQSWRAYRGTDKEKAREYLEEHRQEMKEASRMRAAADKLKEMRVGIERIFASTQLDMFQKREMLNDAYIHMINVARLGVGRSKLRDIEAPPIRIPSEPTKPSALPMPLAR
jgi:GH24 family phage-related lysozyme (muramidase)